MATPTQEELLSFGDLILPFQRNKRGKTIEKDMKDAHKINTIESNIGDKIYDAVNNGLPNFPNEIKKVTDLIFELINKRELDNDNKKEYCFLWILDDGGIKILWENVENPLDIEDQEVKHSNITNAGYAFHGGELFFTSDRRIFVNNFSDRYGDSDPQHWKAVIAYFRKTFQEYQIIDTKLNDN